MNYANLVDLALDKEFAKVPSLRWTPWVGKNYRSLGQPQRILLIGESHYIRGESEEATAAKLSMEQANKEFTREVIQESRIDGKWTTPTLSNIPRAVLNTPDHDRTGLWQDIAFYNHVQRIMQFSGQSERPSFEDYSQGWEVFMEVVRIINPGCCLFLGSEARHSYHHAMSKHGFPFMPIFRGAKVGRFFSYHTKVQMSGADIPVLFIKHPGNYFSWTKWHELVAANFHAPISRLKNIYAHNRC